MMRVRAIRLWSILAVFAFGAEDAAAQVPAHSFVDLSPRLTVGQSILVTDAKGHVTGGQVVSIVGNQLEIETSIGLFRRRGQRMLFLEDSVSLVHKADSAANGMLIGAGIGTLLGWAMVSNPPENHDGSGDAVLFAGVITAGVFVGEWIDNRIHRLLFASSRKAAISFAPLFAPARVGMAATFRF